MSLGEESGVDTTLTDPGYLLIDRFAWGRIATAAGDADHYTVTLDPGSYFLHFDGSTFLGGRRAVGLTVDAYLVDELVLSFDESGSFDVHERVTLELDVSSRVRGGYALSLEHFPSDPDDLAGNNSAAGRPSAGVTHGFRLDFVSDVDTLRLDLDAGVRYLWTLSSPQIPDLYVSLENAGYDVLDDADLGDGGTRFYTPLTDETVYLTIASNRFISTGRYSFFYQPTLTATLPVRIGTAGNDRLESSAAAELWGWGGNDNLLGSRRADVLVGGEGHDNYLVNAPGDRVVEGRGQGIDLVESHVSHKLARNVENLILGGDAAIDGSGNPAANLLRGNPAANVLYGGLGADDMLGGDGNDTYVVDNRGDRTLEAAAQGIDLVLSAVSHRLKLNIENLTLTGSAAIDGAGNALANLLGGNAAANLLTGSLGPDRLLGAYGHDTLLGGAGNDHLAGGFGNDALLGGAGNDRLAGGVGRDLMNGGAGADVFHFTAPAETRPGPLRDAIRAFTPGEDHIRLSAIDASTLLAGDQAFAFIAAAPFTGRAGQLRFDRGLLEGDVDADGLADFQIALPGLTALSTTDLIL